MLHHGLSALQCDIASLVIAVAVEAEDDLAEDRRGRVVEVNGGLLRADEGFDGAFDEIFASLGEHGDADVIGDRVLFDDLADEVEVDLAGSRETDLDLLEAELDEQVEHLSFAVRCHRVDERLVAVAQVGAQPPRRFADDLVRPGAIAHIQCDAVLERLVFAERHGRRLLQFHCSSISVSQRLTSIRGLRDERAVRSGLVAARKEEEPDSHTVTVVPLLRSVRIESTS